ncbi:hypothetical protein [Nocardia sp. NPDC051750]|uniref:hypothetical protein n=1 Tax=Nocardia sp. NPDC051750 TaxID=3364325 RepID=UPI0037AD94DA
MGYVRIPGTAAGLPDSGTRPAVMVPGRAPGRVIAVPGEADNDSGDNPAGVCGAEARLPRWAGRQVRHSYGCDQGKR